MVLTNQVIVIILGLLLLIGFAFFISKLMRDPTNKGKEIGLIFSELIVKYPMSWFFMFLALLNLSEAILAAGFAASEVSPLARMLTHSTMAALSIFAGLVWTKEITGLADAFKQRSFWDVLISLGLVLITTVLSLGTPLLNLIVIANNLQQVEQLNLFFHRVFVLFGLMSTRSFMAELYSLGLPLNYNPLVSTSGVLIASIGVTFFHILLVCWETLKLARSKRESTKHALTNDLGGDPKDKDKDKSKDGDKDKSKDKDTPFEEIISKILKFVGLSDDEVKNKAKSAYKVITALESDRQIKISETFGNLLLQTDKFSGTTDQKKALIDEILATFKKGPSKGGLGMQINPPKKS